MVEVEDLRDVAQQCRDADIAGAGNALEAAADRIATLERDYKDALDRILARERELAEAKELLLAACEGRTKAEDELAAAQAEVDAMTELLAKLNDELVERVHQRDAAQAEVNRLNMEQVRFAKEHDEASVKSCELARAEGKKEAQADSERLDVALAIMKRCYESDDIPILFTREELDKWMSAHRAAIDKARKEKNVT